MDFFADTKHPVILNEVKNPYSKDPSPCSG